MNKMAAYGALTGTIALFLHYLRYRKDRPIIKVKISIQKRDDKSVELDATISNEGKSPTTVTKCYFVNCGDIGKRGTYSIMPPKELSENTAITCGVLTPTFNETGLSPQDICAYVVDSIGRKYWSDSIIMRKIKSYRYNKKVSPKI